MYKKAYGIIETLAPVHVGATAGEESGNLNLIFRDQFTLTGVIPGSSIRGRFRSEMLLNKGKDDSNQWYGHDADAGVTDSTTESLVKFEYASVVWLPVFCPGQPVVWVSCPKLLKRYKRITGITDPVPQVYSGSSVLKPLTVENRPTLFFNFGFLTIDHPRQNLKPWFPFGEELPAVVVADDEIAMIHDMALYRQSRVRLDENEKIAVKGAFFNTEALPEGTQMIFPVAIKKNQGEWKPFEDDSTTGEIYLGGLESIGFGHCAVELRGL
ncbi:type III-B CRISPR module RAMP protein Cmr4 [Cyanobacterium stanieri LEGE 03274]|uniref:Type III-B CRISPR module RAMP protein Cmr4 n=1 Tax=Cyanobacterium stanieri LEGE 03274 TaxID=1828756 RepID=A0ABR9V1K2_9CHRO|nr:RAMP superfamily CRISPR-associated protein [Cyanobacterium stanieri]MBE9221763.1 type III-B CRISPR module RAMP protein Cmr4 [Cyanobacterium stanieri LEGE 03274]